MKPEDAIVHVAGAAIIESADEPARKTRKKQRALELSDRLDILEAERLVLTIAVLAPKSRGARHLSPSAQLLAGAIFPTARASTQNRAALRCAPSLPPSAPTHWTPIAP